MRKILLACVTLAAFAAFSAPAFAGGGCSGMKTATGGSFETADASTVSGPSTPVPAESDE